MISRGTQDSLYHLESFVPGETALSAVDWTRLKPVRDWENVDAEMFAAEIAPSNKPAVFRDFAGDWPAVVAGKAGPREFASYVAGFAADRVVEAFFAPPDIKGRFFYSDDLRGFNFERRQLALGELLDTLLAHLDTPNPPCIYAGAIPLTDGLTRLRQENQTTLVDPDRAQLVSIWIGNRGRVAAHWDLPQNIAAVVAGRRRFTLFPTEQVKNLYVGPLDLTIAGQPISLVDFHAPDLERFPRFADALEHAVCTELGPGDAIYIPSLWFHHVESLDPLGALINYWWRDAKPHMFTPRITLLHALLSIRDLPEHERLAWRTMFDHYIFQVNGDPMAHIPDEARGIFGDMNEERLTQIRASLLRSMGIKLRN